MASPKRLGLDIIDESLKVRVSLGVYDAKLSSYLRYRPYKQRGAMLIFVFSQFLPPDKVDA